MGYRSAPALRGGQNLTEVRRKEREPEPLQFESQLCPWEEVCSSLWVSAPSAAKRKDDKTFHSHHPLTGLW